MDNSRLLSNEPLKLLGNHIKELKKLWKKENDENKKLKNTLKNVKEMILGGSFNGKTNEILNSIELAVPCGRSLNNSYHFHIESNNSAGPLLVKVFKYFEKSLNYAFENLKILKFRKSLKHEKITSKRNHKINRSLGNFDGIDKNFQGIWILQVLLRKKIKIVMNIVRKSKITAEKCENCQKIIIKNLIKTLKGILNLRLFYTFKAMKKYIEKKVKKIGNGIKIINKIIIKNNNSIKKGIFSSFRKEKKVQTFEIKINSVIKKYKLKTFEELKKFAECLLIFDQGICNIIDIINPYFSSLKSTCFNAIKSLSTFKSIQSNSKPSKITNLNARFFCMVLRNLYKNHLHYPFLALNFPHESQIVDPLSSSFLKISLNFSPQFIKLNKMHHEISEKLLILSNIPNKIAQNLKKTSFLQIVAFVTQDIGYNSILFNVLSRFLQIVKFFQLRQFQKSFATWKSPSKRTLQQKPFKSIIILFPIIQKRQKFFFSKLKFSSPKIRKSIINLKVIVEQQNYMKKAKYFSKWASLISSSLSLSPLYSSKIKENFDFFSNSFQKPVIPELPLDLLKFAKSTPLRVIKYN